MRILARFNGPPGSGNGGWAARAFAQAAGARAGGPPVEVTLRVPVPLDTELTVSDGAVRHGETLVASLAWPEVALAAVDPAGPGEARAAAATYPGFAAHPFPTCYVCGPDRPDGTPLATAGATWIAVA
jgi:hypothetical protein